MASPVEGFNPREHVMFYVNPINVELSYIDITKEPVSKPQEAEAVFQLNGKQEVAFVPLYAVNEEAMVASGFIVGEFEGGVIVEFPPTTLGQSRFTALQSDLDNIMVTDRAEV